MSLTESTMLALGSQAPAFSLPSSDGTTVTLDNFAQYDALVVLFICNHCPYVIHIAPALATLAKRYQQQGIGFVAINSNDTDAYPADSMANMQKETVLRGYTFPYLLDDEQSVAKAYSAACTPDIYVFDQQRNLIYRGEFDSTRPHRISSGNYDASNGAATGASLAEALDAHLQGGALPDEQKPSMGCNIKWKPGNEPSYY